MVSGAASVQTRASAQIALEIDGAAASNELMGMLSRVTVESSAHLPDQAVLEFHNPDLSLSDRSPPHFAIGARLLVELGERDNLGEVFDGEVTGIEVQMTSRGVPTLSVYAYDRLHRLLRGTKTRTWLDSSDSDVATQVARDHGLTPRVQSTPTLDHVIQHGQSDWDFLQSRARRLGFEVRVVGRELHFKPPPSVAGDDVTLSLRSQLSSLRARLSTGEQVDEVTVRGWDPTQKVAIVGTASRAQVTRSIGERKSGAAMAQDAFGSARVVISRQPVHTQEQADALAQALLDELGEAFVVAEGTALGDPALKVGATFQTDGLGEQFNGTYVVTEARHIYASSGYRNEFRATGRRSADVLGVLVPPDASQSAPALDVLPAVVTNAKDEKEGNVRVQVRYPTLGDDVQSDWCRVVSPGAGPKRGLQFIPEVDDEVLVASVSGDLSHPYVLGGLWNGKDAPPEGTSELVDGAGKVSRRLIRSRSGHLVILDDSDETPGIRVIDSSGNNSFEIDTANKALKIVAEGDLTIESGGKLEIRAGGELKVAAQAATSFETPSSFDISSSGNLTVEASGNLTLKGMQAVVEGSAKATLKAPTASVEGSALAEVKGALVKLN